MAQRITGPDWEKRKGGIQSGGGGIVLRVNRGGEIALIVVNVLNNRIRLTNSAAGPAFLFRHKGFGGLGI